MSSIPILFGTETGNAEYCAKDLASALTQAGYASQAIDLRRFDPERLRSASLVFVVSSTCGQGDAPVSAEKLLDHLKTAEFELAGLRYGVCALGDSSYENFAQCGRDFDRHLERHGARRVVDLCVCDADFEDFFPAFKKGVLAYVAATGDEFRGPSQEEAPKPGFFKKLFGRRESKVAVSESAGRSAAAPVETPAEPSAHDPFPARIVARRRLNLPGSSKETMHYELSLAGTGLRYEPGDCIAVHPRNSPEDVARFLTAFRLDGAEPVRLDTRSLPLSEALATRDLQRITSALAEILARAQGPLAGPDAKEYRHRRHVLEALSEHTALPVVSASDLLEALLPLPPRLYSIASSQRAAPDRVHLTVDTPRYQVDGFSRVGLASSYLCDRTKDGDSIVIHQVAGTHFRLAPPDTDIICIGPGTGVAPYRAFLQERQATGATGRTWLFFGHQHEATDFFYRDEFEAFLRDGTLTRLDCAWSRDQAEKRYVQHLLWEKRTEVLSWLDAGAVVYVCGDKQHMAQGVHRVFTDIVASQGRAPEAAEAYVRELEHSGRYLRDVY